MANNFDLRQFLTENRLTKNTQLLKEEVSLNGKPVHIGSIEIDGIDMNDYPDFVDAYIVAADFEDGTPLTDDEVEQFQDENYDLVGELIHDRQLYLEGKGVNEAKSYKVSKNSKEAQHLKKGDIIGSGDEVLSVSAGAKTPSGKVEVTLKTKAGKTKTSTWGKTTKVGVKEKETVKENKMTQRDKYLTRLVENALGLDPDYMEDYPEEEELQNILDRNIDQAMYKGEAERERGLEEGDEMTKETIIPEYNTVDELMREIDNGTNKVAEAYKISEMKKIAEALRERKNSLEESEHAQYMSKADLIKLGKDITAIDKAVTKLEAAFDKKFNKKEKPASAPKAEKVEALQETTMENFNLKKFLIENKLTTNSRMISENYKVHDLVFIKSNGQFETKPREIHQISGNQYVVSGHIKKDLGGYSTEGGKAVDKEDVKLASLDENGTYTQKEILRGSMQGFKAPNPEELKVNMMIAPNMSYGNSQEQLNQEMGRITAISGDKVTYKKGDGKLYNANVDDIIIVAS